MTDNQQKWVYVIGLIAVPFVIVHLGPGSPLPRLLSVIWLATTFPVVILLLLIYTKGTIRFRNYSNHVIEARVTALGKILLF
jgi:hypothetical protein